MEFYTLDDFEKVKKIDAHFHALSQSEILLKYMKEHNFGAFSICCDVCGHGYPTVKEQLEVMHKHKVNPSLDFAFATSFEMEGFEDAEWVKKTIEYLEYSFSQGATAVKVWKNIGMEYQDKDGNFVQIDDEKFTPVINYIQSQGYPLLGHIGEPKNCWLPLEEMTANNDRNYYSNHPEFHMYLHPELPKYESIIAARDRMLARHLDLTYVGCHLGSQEWSVDLLATMFDSKKNYAVDLAHRMGHVQFQSKADREKVRNFFIKYQDRIMYGTDNEVMDGDDENAMKEGFKKTWLQDWKYFVSDEEMTSDYVDGGLQGLHLPKEVVDKIYYLNAKRWYEGFDD